VDGKNRKIRVGYYDSGEPAPGVVYLPSAMVPPRGSNPYGMPTAPVAYQVIDFPQTLKLRRSVGTTRS